MKKRLLCFIMKNNQVYNIGDDNIFKQDKNCYIVTKYGSMAHPAIFYDEKYNGTTIVEQELIGGYKELIEFLSDKSNSKVYLRGFNRSTIGRIHRLVIEKQSNENTKSNINDDGNKVDLEQIIINMYSTGLSQKCRMVANYIIDEFNKNNEGKSFREQISLSPRKLQKLLYFCDVEHMKSYNGVPMFRDVFYAWPSGPVIPRIYYKYMQWQDGKMNPINVGINTTITGEMKLIIDRVLEEVKQLDITEMEAICRADDGPWAQAYDANDKEHNQIISKESMYNYYRENKKKIRKR